MCAAEYGVLNLQESPRFGSRNLENSYEKLQQIGQGTYGYHSQRQIFFTILIFNRLCCFHNQESMSLFIIAFLLSMLFFSLVYVAKDCATGEIVALKKLIMNKGLPGVIIFFIL